MSITSALSGVSRASQIPVAQTGVQFLARQDGLIDRIKDRLKDVLNDLAAATPPTRPDLDDIRQNNQVVDDTITTYRPQFGPLPINIPFVGETRMTQTEADLLNELGDRRGLNGLRIFRNITSNTPQDPGLAYRAADEYFPQFDDQGGYIKGGEDGHNDAFRHVYWNALMTDRFGEDFAAAFATAHEGVPGNPANKEAMDLYNNALGRDIARDNPGASDEELAELVFEAVNNGDAVVIDASGDLAFSDQVAIGQTGDAPPGAIDGVIAPPEWSQSS